MALRSAVVSVGKGGGRNPKIIHSIPKLVKSRFHASSSAAPSLYSYRTSHFYQLQVGVTYKNTCETFKHQIRAINTETSVETKASVKEDEHLAQDWKIKMLYDGECPLCLKEVNMLKERNKSYRTIKFVDISSDDYSPEENQGLDYETAMGRIHAIQSDGTVVTDVEAFRRLYEEVGLGWVYVITKYEPVATIANAVYGVWAKYRMQVTGRPSLEEIFEARRKNRGEVCRDKSANM
ncbi:hypothetical protein AQUCO_00200303v1 [Aquilegia coerulea]|uniref:Thiol-disulfide oxidoreductase DCC n=1 Tax=Aquilegia coerulea TaxID=218851 RepID=A0A2G5F2P2_AQUCA|nr:hypothetical protein AQUCO_00200303v1 [Aquilegia coerulea]PIA62215.1 hypothetical protein AQUCO_00200303v1 [Aquilegia coerulea]PIA62216.1 hypothetical protein AQUCO_00200303v1 [Aquilegia coerulea]PIA62220.1 hypothetical protein AQUCO_00200303v1 [Aquilegia coerulea]